MTIYIVFTIIILLLKERPLFFHPALLFQGAFNYKMNYFPGGPLFEGTFYSGPKSTLAFGGFHDKDFIHM